MKWQAFFKHWQNLSIAKKIILTVSGLVGATVISTAISGYLFFSLSKTYYQVLQGQETWFAQNEIKNSIYLRINAVLQYVSTGNPDFLHLFEQSNEKVHRLEEYLLTRTQGEELEVLKDFIEESQDWEFLLYNKVIPVYQMGNQKDAWFTLTHDGESRALALIQSVDRFTTKKQEEMKKLALDTVEQGKRYLWTGIILSLTAVFVSILLGFILIRSLTKPILALQTAARLMGKDGDFRHTVPVMGEDELGQLALAFNRMGERLNQLIDQLSTTNLHLREESRKAQEANRLKSEFLANISHELRTPLNGIIGFSEVLHEEMFGPLTEKQKEYVGHIQKNGEHLLHLINDLLDLSKIEAGKMELSLKEVEIDSFFRNSLVVIQERAKKNGITLEMVNKSNSSTFFFDPVRVTQIMNNLLSNAVKFTPAGGKITVRIEESPDFLQVSVEDTGIGIREDRLEKIFLPFYQDEGQLDRRYEGTGLGLSLTRRLVELHGGSIVVKSRLGRGSLFTFTLKRPVTSPVRESPSSPGGSKIWVIGPITDPDAIKEIAGEREMVLLPYHLEEKERERMDPPAMIFITDNPELPISELVRLPWFSWSRENGYPLYFIRRRKLTMKEKGELFRFVKKILPQKGES
ncbi:sensor histidine kinase [Thermicanus aegyptius]|uniref:sensor histidine kinase n=1 Tax=Thermicanus aegyptius TaxID=94009 RepID=UPI0003F8BB32|nr:ATP-binding protein [Thermicanus aegyptius]